MVSEIVRIFVGSHLCLLKVVASGGAVNKNDVYNLYHA